MEALSSCGQLSPPHLLPQLTSASMANGPLWGLGALGHPIVTSWGFLSPSLTLGFLRVHLTSSRKPPSLAPTVIPNNLALPQAQNG